MTHYEVSHLPNLKTVKVPLSIRCVLLEEAINFQEPYAADPVPAAPLCLPLRVPNFSKRLLSVTSSFTQVCIPQPTKEGIQDVKPVI